VGFTEGGDEGRKPLRTSPAPKTRGGGGEGHKEVVERDTDTSVHGGNITAGKFGKESQLRKKGEFVTFSPREV